MTSLAGAPRWTVFALQGTVVIGAAALFGALVAVGDTTAYAAVLLAALALAAVLAPLVAEFALPSVIAWVVMTGALYPFLRFGSGPLFTFDRVAVGVMVAILLFRTRTVPMAPATRIATIAFGWLAVAFGARAALASVDRLSALQTWVDAILIPLVLFLVVRQVAVTRDAVYRIAGAMTIAGVVIAAIGIGERAFGYSLASRTGSGPRLDLYANEVLVRISGPYAVPETFAVVVLMCLAATIYWTIARRPGPYIVGVTAIVIQLGALGLTLFRAAWIAALVVLVLALGWRPGRRMRLLAVGTLVAALVAAVGLQLGQSDVVSSRVGNTDNIESRFASYKEAIELFRGDPVFGVGVHQYNTAANELPTVTVGGVGSTRYPHNSYTGLAAEQGIVGVLPLIALSFAVAWLLHALRRRAQQSEDVILGVCVAAATTAYLLMSLTLQMLPYGPSNAFLAVLLGLAAARLDVLSRVWPKREPDGILARGSVAEPQPNGDRDQLPRSELVAGIRT